MSLVHFKPRAAPPTAAAAPPMPSGTDKAGVAGLAGGKNILPLQCSDDTAWPDGTARGWRKEEADVR